MNSFTFFTGSDGCTTSALSASAVCVTATKSFTGSNGSFEKRLGFTAIAPTVPSRIV